MSVVTDEKGTKQADATLADADGIPVEAEVGQAVADYGADSGLARRLSSRHLLMISMGASIGQGLWLGSGSTIHRGGPAGLLLGYIISGSVGWAVNQSIGEMAILYPVPSAFPQWTRKFVDSAPAFTLGWAYWFSSSITIGNELQGLVTVMGFWTDKVPTAAWLTIFLILVLLVCVSAVALFGEIECFMTIVKFIWVFIVLLVCIVISAGGAPKGGPIGFRYWNSNSFNHNGFHGFLSVFPTCIFALGGSELTGVVAAESKNPLKAVPKAISAVWIRLTVFYVIGSLAVSVTTDPNNADLFGGTGTNASPFVIAFRASGLPGLAHVMNVIILISVWSCANASAYGATRTPIGLASIGMAPKIFLKCDDSGRPWGGIIISFILGGGLSCKTSLDLSS
jgi:amino acid transporter